MSSVLAPPPVAARDSAAPPRPRRPAVPYRRVLHLVNGEHYAGAERVQDLLGLELAAHGYEPGYVCLRRGRYAALRRSRHAPLVTLPMRSKLDLAVAHAVAELARRGGYELLHSHTPRSALVGSVASLLTGLPLVHHLHSPATADTTRRWQNFVNAAVERQSLSRVRALIAVSHSLSEYARRQGFPAKHVHVVHNGVPPLGPLAERTPPEQQWTLGAVALFRPRKGLEVLIEALALLREQGHQVRLRAVGNFETSDYKAQIDSLVLRLRLRGQIDWVGFARDVPAELARMDLFVLPSLQGEGLPMVVLEAMAAGVPLVATRVEGVPEAIRDGLDGVLAPPADARALAAAIGRIVTGELGWQALRTSAHQRQAQSFSDASMTAGVARVYDQVLESCHRAGRQRRPDRQLVAARRRRAQCSDGGRLFRVLGVDVIDDTFAGGIARLARVLASRPQRPRSLYFVNAHTLNCAAHDLGFRDVLAAADFVYGDGTGVRWAARLQGLRLQANLNGTDLIPALLAATAECGYSLYLVGGDAHAAQRAADRVQQEYPGWRLAGCHHGYLDERTTESVVADINRRRPDLLLVGMGNPLQERWIHRHRERLDVALCVGVGALIDRWAGELVRAPAWLRRAGCEWLDILRRQPHKWRRYLLGNPLYLARVVDERLRRGHRVLDAL